MNKLERTTRDVEVLKRSTESRHREVVDSVPDDDEGVYDGLEKMIENADGTKDMLKYMGGKWVRLSNSLDGLKVKVVDKVPGLEIEIGGKRFRINMEEI